VKQALKLDQSRPGETMGRERDVCADLQERLGRGESVGCVKACQFVGSHLFQGRTGAAPLGHPFALEARTGGHESIMTEPRSDCSQAEALQQLVLRPLRLRQTQEYEDGAVERPHVFGRQ
jgi:hypothetical protein